MSAAIVESEAYARIYLENIDKIHTLKTIIVLKEFLDYDIVKEGVDKGVLIIPYHKVEELGAKHPKKMCLPDPDNIAMLIYTSGTTGDPKGVVIDHKTMTNNSYMTLNSLLINKMDFVHLSYLPLAHIFERAIQFCIMYNGGRIGFWRGIQDNLIEDIQGLQPTVLIAPPRVLNKIHDKVFKKKNLISKYSSFFFGKSDFVADNGSITSRFL